MLERMEKGHGTFDPVNHAIWEIKELARTTTNGGPLIKLAPPQIVQKMAAALYAAGCSKKSKVLDPFIRGLLADIESKDHEDEYYISLSVLIAIKKKMEEWKINDPFALYEQFQGSTPSWEDVETEARKIGQRGASEPVDDGVEDGEIEPGLLNDTDTEGEDHAE